jgi:hypothetical protein
MLGSSGGERRNAFAALERTMQSAGVSWTDIGEALEHAGEPNRDDSKYTEAELREYGQALRAEGVEAGIQVGMARKSNDGAGVLPSTPVMAEYCHQRSARLKSDWQRDFVTDIFVVTRHTKNVSLSRLANLAKIYIEIGGRI